MAKPPHHVIWDNSVEGCKGQTYPAIRFRCLHCGAVYDMATPVPIRLMGAASRAWLADHRRCPEPKPEAPEEPKP